MDKCLCFHMHHFTAAHPFIISAAKSFKDNIIDSISKPSISAGVGLIYRFDPVRVEANFGVPLVASKSDGSRRGFQVGIGLDFL